MVTESKVLIALNALRKINMYHALIATPFDLEEYTRELKEFFDSEKGGWYTEKTGIGFEDYLRDHSADGLRSARKMMPKVWAEALRIVGRIIVYILALLGIVWIVERLN